MSRVSNSLFIFSLITLQSLIFWMLSYTYKMKISRGAIITFEKNMWTFSFPFSLCLEKIWTLVKKNPLQKAKHYLNRDALMVTPFNTCSHQYLRRVDGSKPRDGTNYSMTTDLGHLSLTTAEQIIWDKLSITSREIGD